METPFLKSERRKLIWISLHNAKGSISTHQIRLATKGRHIAKREFGVVRAALTSPQHGARAKLPGRYNL